MIQMLLLIFTSCVGLGRSASLSREGPFTPAPLGMRPACASERDTFCEKVDKYPTKLIQSLLQSKQSLPVEDLFIDDSAGLEEPPDSLHEYLMIFSDKSGKTRKVRSIKATTTPEISDTELTRKCTVLTQQAHPRAAANKDGEWRHILQDHVFNATQRVEVSLCSKNEACIQHCMQFYAPVSLISLSAKGLPTKDAFWLPSSCRCHKGPVFNEIKYFNHRRHHVQRFT